MKQKVYFKDLDSEECALPKKAWTDYMEENNLKDMTVYEAKAHKESEYFFCRAFAEATEKNGTCGKECKEYVPRNGIKGICTFHHNFYEAGKEVKLKIK